MNMTTGHLTGILSRARVLFTVVLALVVLPWAPRPAPAAEFLTGQLLVAAPRLADPAFRKTVVLVLRHDRGGALGLIVNRQMSRVSLDRLLQSFDFSGRDAAPDPAPAEKGEPTNDVVTVPVFYGGPVEPFLGFTLHSRDVMPENSVPVGDALAYSVGDNALRALAAGAGPSRVIFLLGYAGWAPRQLENELKRGDWFVVAGDADLVFSDVPAHTWERAIARFSTEL